MGFFSWIFGGGNVGMIAKSIAKQHNTMGDFNAVLDIYMSDFGSREKGSQNYSKAMQAQEMILYKKIKNYRDLAILALFVDSAPANYNFYDVSSLFSHQISKHLTKNGIDEHHISGNLVN